MSKFTEAHAKTIAWLENLGVDPKQVHSVVVNPDEVLITQFVLKEDGTREHPTGQDFGPVYEVRKFAMKDYLNENQ